MVDTVAKEIIDHVAKLEALARSAPKAMVQVLPDITTADLELAALRRDGNREVEMGVNMARTHFTTPHGQDRLRSSEERNMTLLRLCEFHLGLLCGDNGCHESLQTHLVAHHHAVI